jgi:hypothetical protein
MNSENASGDTPAGASRGRSAAARKSPSVNGTTMLTTLVAIATVRCARKCRTSSSVPTRNMKIVSPSWLSA